MNKSKIMSGAVALTLASLAGVASATEPALPSPLFPIYASPAAITTSCDAGLAATSKRLKHLERRKIDGGWIAAFDSFVAASEDAQLAIDFTQYVHPDKAMRDAAQACSLRWADFNSTLGQDEKLYKAMKKAPAKDAIDHELVRVTLGNFEDGGVALPADKRARVKQLLDKITELDQQFNKNIREAGVKVVFTESEMAGVPEGVWKNAPRDEQGRIVLGVENPVYQPVMQMADSAAARERMWFAKTNEGGDANLQILGQIATLRHELAGLFGYGNYVDFNLRHKMAKDSATAWKFLDEVKSTVAASDRADMAELRKVKAEQMGTPVDATELKRWDESYYTERLRQARYSVDQEAFRAYLPPEETFRLALHVIEKMMGVRYTRVQASLWHPEVETFVVSDAASGKAIAQLYVDLYPREGKYNHAAVWDLRTSSTLTGRKPAAALVVNFDRKGLTLGEFEVMLHELGHSVHNNLSNTRYVSQAGTKVMHDFVEAPSQMLEDWVYDKNVLKLMADVCPSCKPIPDEMVDKAAKAREFAKGAAYARQHLYASYDLALHGPEVTDPLVLWSRMEGATTLGYVPGSKFPSRFAHLTSDYGAGYYGYLWSKVLAMDLRTAFKADKLDPVVGARYRAKVLSQGGQRPAPELVDDFLGRPWNSKAFFDDLRGTH